MQTFVLAEQPNGYYVLNDVFRYLVDEEVAEDAAISSDTVEEPELQAPAQTAAGPTTGTEESKVVTEEAAAKIDEKLEKAEEAESEAPAAETAPQTNGTEQPEPAAEVVETPAPAAEVVPEKPATPEPSPAPPAEKEAPTKEPAPPAKAVPKTWASIASKTGAAAPVVPAIPVAPVKPAPAAAPASQPAAPAPAPAPAAAPAAESVPSQPSSNDGSGWQTAGHDHKKSQARASDNQAVLGYIKNVTEKVNADLLKETLERYGKLTHFDVSRQKVLSLSSQFRRIIPNFTDPFPELCIYRVR